LPALLAAATVRTVVRQPPVTTVRLPSPEACVQTGILSPLLRPMARPTLPKRVRCFANRSPPLSSWSCKARNTLHRRVPPIGQGSGRGLVGQDPVDRRSVHLEQRGNDLHGLALGAQGARMGDLLRRQFGLGAECDPTLPSGWDTGAGAFGHQTTLQFSQDANHLPHGAAGGCLRVNMLRQRAKRDAVGTQLIQQGDEVTQATASAVQFPDNEGIAWAEGFEAPGERRALGCRA
jgi:hypothetical protein